MRIALDATPTLAPRTGMGRYLEGLVPELLALDPNMELLLYAFFARDYARRAATILRPDSARATVVTRALPERFLDCVWGSPFAGALPMERLLGSYDGIHFGHLAAAPTRRPAVYTLHDATAWHRPEDYPGLSARRLRVQARRLREGAGPVLCLSRATLRDARDLLGLAPARLRVVYPGVDPRFRPAPEEEGKEFLARRGIKAPFFVAVGGLEPRKNLLLLLDAFAASAARRDGVRLLLLGPRGTAAEEILRRIAQSDLATSVTWEGHVDDETLPCYYRASCGLLFPSRGEGFGLPVLEAMACGAPVAASNVSSIPEIVGEAGLLLPPQDRGAWTEAIDRLATGGARVREAAARGLVRSAGFTWHATATGCLAAYREVLSL